MQNRTWQWDMRNLTLQRKDEILKAKMYLAKKTEEAFKLFFCVGLWLALGMGVYFLCYK